MSPLAAAAAGDEESDEEELDERHEEWSLPAASTLPGEPLLLADTPSCETVPLPARVEAGATAVPGMGCE